MNYTNNRINYTCSIFIDLRLTANLRPMNLIPAIIRVNALTVYYYDEHYLACFFFQKTTFEDEDAGCVGANKILVTVIVMLC